MLVSSRSLAEYVAFFDLTAADRRLRILDCAAGASGFAAQANGDGGRVSAVDPAYAHPGALLADAQAAEAQGMAIIAEHEDRFTWAWYGDRENRHRLRADARAAFTADLRARPQTYLAAALPDLPFGDGAFDLALCSHLLFTWSDVLDAQWHEQALRELLRVARQVRVFPLVRQGSGAEVPFLPALCERLREDGHEVAVRAVPYEFQTSADTMLVAGTRRLVRAVR